MTPETPFDIPDQIQVADRTIHDDTEHPEETLTTSQILAQSSNVGAIKIGMLEGASAFNGWVHRFGFGVPDRRRVARRGRRRGARTGPLLGLLDGQPADRSGRARHADPDGERLFGDRQRRHPASTAHRGSVWGAAPSPSRPATASSRPPPRRHCGRCSRASWPRAGPPARSRSRATSSPARRAPPEGRSRQPGSTPNTPTSPRSSASLPRSDPKLLCAVIVDEPQAGSIYGGTVAAPAFGQIMSFALPYLRHPAGIASAPMRLDELG